MWGGDTANWAGPLALPRKVVADSRQQCQVFFFSAFNKTVRFLLQLRSPGEAGGLHGFTRWQSLPLSVLGGRTVSILVRRV